MWGIIKWGKAVGLYQETAWPGGLEARNEAWRTPGPLKSDSLTKEWAWYHQTLGSVMRLRRDHGAWPHYCSVYVASILSNEIRDFITHEALGRGY